VGIIFSGHAGKHAAEWCGQNFHEFLLDGVITNPHTPIPDLLNKTFHAVDRRLFQLAEEDRTHSGCTAVTAFLRVEEDDEQANDQGGPAKGFTNPGIKSRGLLEGKGIEELERLTSAGGGSKATVGGAASSAQNQDESLSSGSASVQRRSSRKMIKDFVKGLTGGKESSSSGDSGSATGSGRDGNGSLETIPDGTPSPLAREGSMPIADGHHMVDLVEPKSEKPLRRVLYTANVGDARAVLWWVATRIHDIQERELQAETSFTGLL
jgi:protein phosphatase PTC1